MAVHQRRQQPATKPLDIPLERPVATGELVSIRDLPEHRRKHGLRVVRAFWLPTERYPRLIVEEDPKRGEEQQ